MTIRLAFFALLLTIAAMPVAAQTIINTGSGNPYAYQQTGNARNFNPDDMPDLETFTAQDLYQQDPMGFITPYGQQKLNQAGGTVIGPNGQIIQPNQMNQAQQQQNFTQQKPDPKKQIYRGGQRDPEESPRTHRMYEPTQY